jgi:cell volume regulation protein A
MHHSPEAGLIFAAGALLAAGLGASLLAGRLRVPGLVLFLAVGMAVGTDGLGWIDFSDYALARTIGVIALALILFEGGLAVDFGEIRPVLAPAITLAVLGTVITAAITGAAAAVLFDFDHKEGALVGAILAATDGAAIFSVLRGSPLRRRLALTLEAESGFNDPVAVVLVLAGIDWITDPGYGVGDLLALIAEQFGLGLVVGVAVGRLAVLGFRRAGLASSGLYPVASLAVAALAYGGAAVIDGSGFLAVYIAGLSLGSAAVPAKRTIRIFHEGLGWVAQLAMFVTLGLLVFPSHLDNVALKGTALGLVLVFVARPVATVLSTAPLRIGLPEQAALGWAGLRGAVPVVLATFPVIAHVPRAVELFDIVFFAVVLSTLLQGSSFEAVARWLGVTEPAVRPSRRGVAPGREMIFTVRPWPAGGGNPAYPREVAGVRVAEVVSVRRDAGGSLVALDDGRYALCGPVLAVGSRDDVIEWARRRVRAVPEEERAWLQRGIGALAAGPLD